MAAMERSSSIPRNYGSTQLNFTSFDFGFLEPQNLVHESPEREEAQYHSTTPYCEFSEEKVDEFEAALELCYIHSNTSSTHTSSTASTRDGIRSGHRQPTTRAEQDEFIDCVIDKLNSYSMVRSTTTDRSVNEDAALWMRVWGSARVVKDARTKRRTKEAMKAKDTC